jgi:hypothetical protein
VFVLALALRLSVIWLRPLEEHAENIKAGFTLAKHRYLGDPFMIATGPTAHVSPAYPLLVAGVRAITPSDGACMRTLSVILAVVTSCNIAALIPISRALKLPRGSGTIAALMWLVPLFAWIELSGEFETTLIVTVLLGLMTLVMRTVEQEHPTVVTGARLGLVSGLAAYFTPTVLPMTVLATLTGARLVRWKPRTLLVVSAGGALAFALVILPYTLRNHHTFGAWFFMRDNFGLELAISNGPHARALQIENLAAGGTLNIHPSSAPGPAMMVRELGEVEYNRRLQRAAIAWIAANPRAFVKLVAARAGYLVLPYSTRWWQRALAGAISVMSIAGCILLWRSRCRFVIRCLTAAIVGYLFVYLLIEHDIRYIYPALFLESLIAGSFLVELRRMWRDRNTRDAGLHC